MKIKNKKNQTMMNQKMKAVKIQKNLMKVVGLIVLLLFYNFSLGMIEIMKIFISLFVLQRE